MAGHCSVRSKSGFCPNHMWGTVGWALDLQGPCLHPPLGLLCSRRYLTLYQAAQGPRGPVVGKGDNPSPLPEPGGSLGLWSNMAPVPAPTGCQLGLRRPQFSHL